MLWEEGFSVTQSLPICCTLAAIGGLLEVGATAMTAVPVVRETQGQPMSRWTYWLMLAGNLCLQAIGSLMSHLVATWYGPISIVVPFFYSATLLSNILIFGVVLGREFFSKTTKVGSYIIVVAVILLPVVGPTTQNNQDIVYLFHRWYAVLWFTLLLCTSTVTGILLVYGIDKFATNKRFWILLTARAASISVNLTVSRSFILSPSKVMLICFLILKIASGCVYTYAIIVQGNAVDQARFVPLNTTTIIVVNALTGILIWEDWRVIQSWYGYACVFVLLALGCDLLLTVALLHEDNPMFGTNQRASILFSSKKVGGSGGIRSSSAIRPGYHPIADLRLDVPTTTFDEEDVSSSSFLTTPDHRNNNPLASIPRPQSSLTRTMSRRDAWRTIINTPSSASIRDRIFTS
jgi:hypothetical protein